ncbi:MAG TPA: RsmD family RNA methyltransferase [Candidatus Limnocylindrales bacterium]|jgi:16S rRNA (guanine966-N2)-methyltransferase
MPDAGRVIAGVAGGIRLRPAGPGTRPLSDRVKQACFGILETGGLAPWPTPFLDVFAGSGAAGIEALSRGAPAAAFLERDRRALAAIAANLEACRLTEHGLVLPGDALAVLAASMPAGIGPFGAALVDPPYGDATLVPALARLAEPTAGWLAEEAVVVAKHFWRDAPAEHIGRLSRVRERRFGETALSFYVVGGR